MHVFNTVIHSSTICRKNSFNSKMYEVHVHIIIRMKSSCNWYRPHSGNGHANQHYHVTLNSPCGEKIDGDSNVGDPSLRELGLGKKTQNLSRHFRLVLQETVYTIFLEQVGYFCCFDFVRCSCNWVFGANLCWSFLTQVKCAMIL